MASFSASGVIAIKSALIDARFRVSGVIAITSQALGDPVFKDASWYTFPARRIGYDLDGSRVFLVASERLDPDNKGTLSEISPQAVEGMNGDYVSGLVVEGRRYYVVAQAGFPDGVVKIDPGFWGEATYENQNNYVVIFFAKPMRIRAWYSQVAVEWQQDHLNPRDTRGGPTTYPLATLQASPDTTNGQDGTWHDLDYRDANLLTTITTTQGYVATGQPTSLKLMDGRWVGDITYPETDVVYFPTTAFVNADREEFTDGRLDDRGWFPVYTGWTRNVTAIRLAVPAAPPGGSPSLRVARILLHLYGEPDNGAGTMRLAVVDPDTDIELKKDPSWGNVDKDSTNVIRVGIKNLSPTMTATGVVVSIASSWPDGAPIVADDGGITFGGRPWLLSPMEGFLHVSTDETTWAESLPIGDLTPGQTVEIFARQEPVTSHPLPPGARNPPGAGVIGMRLARILAETEGWV